MLDAHNLACMQCALHIETHPRASNATHLQIRASTYLDDLLALARAWGAAKQPAGLLPQFIAGARGRVATSGLFEVLARVPRMPVSLLSPHGPAPPSPP